MPKRKRGGYSTPARPRKRRRSVHQTPRRKIVQRATAKKNARSIRRLFKMSDPKYNYRFMNNVFVFDSTQFNGVELTDLAASVPIATDPNQYLYRESDSTQVRLRNIRLHFSVHCNADDADRSQRVWCALVKTTNGIGSTAGISLPAVGAMWDEASTPGANLLAPWQGFRLTQGTESECLNSTTILKTWNCYLAPQGSNEEREWTTTTTGTGSTTSSIVPAGQLNVNYTQDRKSQRYFTYTHRCLNAIVKYPDAADTDAINVKYFFVCLSQNPDIRNGYYVNLSAKVNFYDN